MPSNSFFDWGASVNRFVRFDAARAEEVNTALDNVTSGFDDVEVKTNAAVKLPDGETATALPIAASRIGKVMSFDGTGQPTLINPPSGIGDVVTDAVQTLTNKTIALGSNTISGTTAQFNNALSDGDFATLAGSETLTNKTLTTPIIGSISNTGTLTLPTSTDTLVGKATTDTLTNKTALALTNTIEARSGPDSSAFGFRNKIINGNFDVWQRSTSAAGGSSQPNSYVSADRWMCAAPSFAAGVTFSRQTGPEGSWYCMRMLRDNGSSVIALYLQQTLETANSIFTQSKNLTLSFKARCGSSYGGAGSGSLNVKVRSGTGTDQSGAPLGTSFTGTTNVINQAATLTTSWQTFTYSTASACGATVSQLSVDFQTNHTGTAADSNDYVEIASIQLEVGQTATPFETRPYGVELALCQRYYEQSYVEGTAPGTATTTNQATGRWAYIDGTTEALTAHFPFKATKRAAPTVTFYSPATGASGQIRNVTGASDIAAPAATASTWHCGLDSANNLATQGNQWSCHWKAEIEL
jgi:hypothetical protein